MSSAGRKLVAGRIPGERIATTISTVPLGGITTTETTFISVTAPLVNGRTYRVRLISHIGSSVNGDRGLVRIREDDDTGTQLQVERIHIPVAGSYPGHTEVEYTATASGDKTFVATLVRESGTGSMSHNAGATQPAYMYVDYIRG